MFFFKCCNPKKVKINNDLKKEFVDFANDRIEMIRLDRNTPHYYKRETMKSYKNAIDSVVNDKHLRVTYIDILEVDMDSQSFEKFSSVLNERNLIKDMRPV